MPVEKSAGIVVFHISPKNRRYLLLHYAAGHWSFPKGHVESGEDEREASLRELNEETGLSENEISFQKGFEEKIEYSFKKGGGQIVQKKVLFFLAKATEPGGKASKTPPEVKLSFEHTGFEWLPFRDAMQRVTYNTDKGVLQKAQDFLEKKKGVVQEKLG